MPIQKTIAHLAATATLALLCACGGGGGEAKSGPATTSVPAPTLLAASAGDLARYTGRWSSDCGLAYASLAHSVRNEYQFDAPVGKVMAGRLRQWQYSDTNCSTALPGIPGEPKVTQAFTLTYADKIEVGAPSGDTHNFAGTADLVQIKTSSATTPTYLALAHDGTVLHVSTDLPFSALSLTYKKP